MTIKIWTPYWWDREKDEPTVECWGSSRHFADTWFIGCPHEPAPHEFTEAARSRCDETDADYDVLDVIARVYFTAWALRGQKHVEQWPLALIVLAGLRDAGYEVVKVTS